MIQKLLFVFAIALITFTATAQEKIILQEELLSSFHPQTLFKGKAKGYIFKVGEGDFQPLGRKGGNIEAILMQDEAAYKEFRKFKKKINAGHISYGLGAAAYLATPFSMSENDSPQVIRTKGIIGISTLVVGTVTGYILHRRCIRNLKKAVDIYNGNL
jgi:hypothetical protein